MPSQMRSESGCHDWSTSYVHLYKLHRGITTAVIQDICFSHDNQWIAIVSSKGTCHIFVISPFGGDTGIQALHSHIQGSILYPDSSPPWWPTSSFAVNEKCSSPPPPCTLSVVSRIKSSDSEKRKSPMQRATYEYLRGNILDVFPEYKKDAEDHLSKTVS
ncbi:Autophagy-related protein 18h [Forsythia ovata]|uniref:Autophagy-related protein 18h n=1 Tax=Forsythia ovata TaxID=205694 RepID=A0ABD1U5Q2_9LAMI